MTDYGHREPAPYPSYEKDPASICVITLPWAKDMKGETIVTSTWDADGLTSIATSDTDTTASITVSGGTDGSKYSMVNTIVTSGGQTLVKRAVVLVREL